MLIKLVRLTATKSVTDKLLKLNSSEHKLRILRLYGRTHERQDYPDPIYTLKLHTENDREGLCQEKFKDDALHHKIRKDDKNEIKKFEKHFHSLLEQNIIPSADERKRFSAYQCIVLCGIYMSMTSLLFFDLATGIALQLQKNRSSETHMTYFFAPVMKPAAKGYLILLTNIPRVKGLPSV